LAYLKFRNVRAIPVNSAGHGRDVGCCCTTDEMSECDKLCWRHCACVTSFVQWQPAREAWRQLKSYYDC